MTLCSASSDGRCGSSGTNAGSAKISSRTRLGSTAPTSAISSVPVLALFDDHRRPRPSAWSPTVRVGAGNGGAQCLGGSPPKPPGPGPQKTPRPGAGVAESGLLESLPRLGMPPPGRHPKSGKNRARAGGVFEFDGRARSPPGATPSTWRYPAADAGPSRTTGRRRVSAKVDPRKRSADFRYFLSPPRARGAVLLLLAYLGIVERPLHARGGSGNGGITAPGAVFVPSTRAGQWTTSPASTANTPVPSTRAGAVDYAVRRFEPQP